MRVAALLISALIAERALADPPEVPPPPQDGTHAKLIAAASVGAVHVAYATWSYFAWYRDADSQAFHLEQTPAFGAATYAGGADKIGHAWSNYALTRGTTAILIAGGWRRLPSSLIAAGLTEVAFTLTELEDGYVHGFDAKDVIANVGGAAFAVLLDNVPAVDRLLDFRVQYFPSADYRRAFRKTGTVDVAQDYSGQSYLLALHLGALPRASTSQYMYWSRYVDLAVGFEAHHYAPAPDVRESAPRQTLYLGLSLNMQGVLNELFDDSRGRRIGRGIAEVYSLPYTTFRYVEASRSPAM